MEEYIIRNPSDALASGKKDQAFKFVVLNERDNRFDYFYYLGIFNKTLPTDLAVALRDVRGKLGTQPEFYLDSYEMGQSNTQDNVLDRASGGHLVKVTYDGTQYTLTDPDHPTDTRTIDADTIKTHGDGTYHEIYDPVADRLSTLTDAQVQAGEGHPAVYDTTQDAYRPLTSADTYWRTSFNAYSHALKGPGYDVVKEAYAKSSSVNTILALHTDADYTWPADPSNGSMYTYSVVDSPSGDDALHARVTRNFADGTSETVNTYIISDEGKIAGTDAFAGLSTGPAFKNELLKWNYEQTIEATEFQGRKIDLVVEPKILIRSGLIP